MSRRPATISRQEASQIQHKLLAHFPAGCTPRAEQARLLTRVGDAIAEALDDPQSPRIFVVEAPPGVGKSHVAMTLARWSGDAYLLTSQKLLQDQYERDFAGEIQVVKGRDLSGASNLLFRRHSQTGAVEAVQRSGSWGGLNEALHAKQ